MPSARTLERTRAALDAQRALIGNQHDVTAGANETLGDLHRACARAVVAGLERGIEPHPDALREAVRYLLDAFAAAAPGKSVEVRVPPYAAVQCVPGPRHTRGTPPNVVETDGRTWVDLAAGRLGWQTAVADGRVQASGERSDLSPYLPLAGS